MSEFSEKMGMAAGNNFKSGYNCCKRLWKPSARRRA